jgi:hypothetical protein
LLLFIWISKREDDWSRIRLPEDPTTWIKAPFEAIPKRILEQIFEEWI